MVEENGAVRVVRWRDAQAVWRIRNEPSVRRVSAQPEPIGLLRHVLWFAHRLLTGPGPFWVATVGGQVVGYLRLEPAPLPEREPGVPTYTLSIALSAPDRGHGLGAALMTTLTRWMATRRVLVVAHVLPENRTGQAFFARCGFVPCGVTRFEGRSREDTPHAPGNSHLQ